MDSKEATTSEALTAEHFFNLLGFFKSLEIQIVAKNIETKGQSLAMNSHEIHLMQGYLFGAATYSSNFIESWGCKPDLREVG